MSTNTYTQEEVQKLEELCRALLKGAIKVSEEPFYITQPFISIILKHTHLINEKRLMDVIPHDLWKTGDKNIPNAIVDSNGEVVLALCKICGGAESSLPNSCPGRRMTAEEDRLVTEGKLQF